MTDFLHIWYPLGSVFHSPRQNALTLLSTKCLKGGLPLVFKPQPQICQHSSTENNDTWMVIAVLTAMKVMKLLQSACDFAVRQLIHLGILLLFLLYFI